MAITAHTRSDTFPYVLDRDPAKKRKKNIPLDPDNTSAGEIITPGNPVQLDNSDFDIDWDNATVFHLHGLDVFLHGYIFDNASSFSASSSGEGAFDVKTFQNRTNIEMVRFGMTTAWRNFKDKKGNDIPFRTVKRTINGREYEAADDASIDNLDLRAIAELAARIREASEVTGDDEKKSV